MIRVLKTFAKKHLHMAHGSSNCPSFLCESFCALPSIALSGSLVHSTAPIDKDTSCCPDLQHDSANIEDRIHEALDARDAELLHEHHPAFPSFPKDPKLRRKVERDEV